MSGVSRCIVDTSAILGESPVRLETEAGERLMMPPEKKSA
jgi:hypothetical protein